MQNTNTGSAVHGSNRPLPERRRYPRLKLRIPVEIVAETHQAPIRTETTDISLSGCYVELLFTLPVGTKLEMSLRVNDDTLLILGSVVTNDAQVGNGIKFIKMLPEDQEQLRSYLESAQQRLEQGTV